MAWLAFVVLTALQPPGAQQLRDQAAKAEEAGDYAAAHRAAREAHALLTRQKGADHWETREAGWEADYYDRLTRATPEQRQALAEATKLDKEAHALTDKGQWADAVGPQERAVALRLKLYGDRHFYRALDLYDLAVVVKKGGDLGRAEKLYREVGPLLEATVGPNHPHVAGNLCNLGSLLQDRGDTAGAEAAYRKALAVCKAGGLPDDHEARTLALADLADLLHQRGDLDEAVRLGRQVVDLRKRRNGAKHGDYAVALHNLATVYLDQGDTAQAGPLLEEAEAVAKAVWGTGHPYYAHFAALLGRYRLSQGDGRGAEPFLRRGAAAAPGPLLHLDLAQAAELRGDRAAANAALAAAEKELEIKAVHPLFALARARLGVHYARRGDLGKAVEYLGGGTRLYGLLADAALGSLSERHRLTLLQSQRWALDAYLGAARRGGVQAAKQYALVLSWKGAVAARSAEDRAVLERPEARPLAADLAQVRKELANLALAGPPPGNPAAWREDLTRVAERRGELEVQWFLIAGRCPNLLLDPATITKALPSGVVLIDLLETVDWLAQPPVPRLAAFVLARGREVAVVDLGPSEPVAEAIAKWRWGLEAGAERRRRAAEQDLGDLLGRPLAAHLDGARAVLIAPDGPLCRFPFAVLPGREPGTTWLDDRAVGYVVSGHHAYQLFGPGPRGLLGPAPAQVEGRGMLAVGGIDYGAAPAGGGRRDGEGLTRRAFAPLTASAPEARGGLEAFRAAFPDQPATLLTGADAGEGRFKQELARRYRCVHVASHGWFAPADEASALAVRSGALPPAALAADDRRILGQHPLLLSGVALAGCNRPAVGGEDGLLTAEEVAGLDLRGTDLVVLSACETGLGEVAGGEGVFGLQRAFQAAGARSLVTSLWKVDDAATARLMTRFYEELWANKVPPLEALRRAQLAIRDEAGSRAHPRLWAAWVLSGDPGLREEAAVREKEEAPAFPWRGIALTAVAAVWTLVVIRFLNWQAAWWTESGIGPGERPA